MMSDNRPIDPDSFSHDFSDDDLDSMSDDELSTLMAASIIGSEDADEGVVENARNIASSRPTESEPSTADDLSTDILDVDDDPMFGARPKPPVDPTEVADEAVSESVKDRESSIDYAALSPDSPSPEEPDEDDGEPDLAAFESELDDEFAGTRFAPYRPTAPEADMDADMDNGTSAPLPSTPPESPGLTSESEPLAERSDVDYDPDDYSEKRESPVSKVASKWKSTPGHLKVATAASAVVVVVLGFFLATSGSEGPESNPGQSAGGGVVPGSGGQGSVPQPDAGSESDEILLNDQIESVSSQCGEGGTETRLAFTTNQEDAWVCPRAFGIDGAVMNIQFRQPVTVTEVRLTTGYNFVRQPSGDDEWNRHRVITNMLWRAGGSQFPQEVVASREEAVFTFPEPVATASMSMTIQRSVLPSETVGEGDEDSAFGSPGGDQGGNDEGVNDATAVQNVQVFGTVG